jgi:TPR repeat protein
MRWIIYALSVFCFVLTTAQAEPPENELRGIDSGRNNTASTSTNTFSSINSMREAAKNGQALAQYQLGRHYTQKGDYVRAYNWFKKASDQGYVKALYMVGLCYSLGRGVPQNQDVAQEWFARAAVE